MDPATIQMIMSALAAGGGLAGGLLSGGSSSLEDELTNRLKGLAFKGPGVNALAAPGVRQVSADSNEALMQTNANLARSGLANTSASVAGPANVYANRSKAMADVYANATAQNENAKQQARAMLMQILGIKGDRDMASAQGYGALTSAGIQGLLRGMYGMGNTASEYGG